ncbi:FANCI solenoid 2-domain-containing protein [Parasitella parasitica]|nr:FANCI solenoid 2-domain-containing protein [Parasitella parasitica]
MDIDIFKYNKQADKQRLIEYLNDQTKEDLKDLISTKLDDYHAANDIDTSLLLRAIIQEKDVLEKPKQAASIVNLILPQFELLPTDLLGTAGNYLIDIIKQEKPIQLRLLDFLSKIWNVLVATDQVDQADDIFRDLMEAKWHHQLVVGMASTLNDIELTNKQLETALICMIKKLADIEIEEVPPYIWHRVEGTVMLHISFALKQDQELGNELVKIVKSDRRNQLKLFNVACLLTAARIHRLQDTIFDLLKSTITSIYKDSDKMDKCHWVSEFSPLDADKYGQVFLKVVERSASSGWDQVVQSLSQLAMIFIDTAANASAFFSGNTNAIKTRSSGSKEDLPMEKVSNLGIDILLKLFKYYDVVRGEILEQITSRIVSRSASVMDFLRLLASIIREYPNCIEKYMSNVNNDLVLVLVLTDQLLLQIKDTLDILSFLPLSTAERLLNAIQPLSKTNEQFRDGLILILRKSLFAK